MQAGVFDLVSGFEGTTEADKTLYHAPTTPEIAYDASAADMEELLETLPSLGQVWTQTLLIFFFYVWNAFDEGACMVVLVVRCGVG